MAKPIATRNGFDPAAPAKTAEYSRPCSDMRIQQGTRKDYDGARKVSDEACKLGSYQVWMGLHSYVEPGTGERMMEEAVGMLEELAG